MNIYDYFAIAALTLAIIVNTLTVYLQRTRDIYKRFGKRAWMVHQIILTLFWGLAVLAGFGLGGSNFSIDRTFPLVGFSIMMGAVLLFAAALKQVGSQGLGNGNFFGKPVKKLGGVYKLINDPMYFSYFFWYLGLALTTGKITFFIMAGIVVVGLIGVESRLESVT